MKPGAMSYRRTGTRVELPRPALDGTHTVERALQVRRSVREYADRSLAPKDLAQLLWAAQGTTALDGKRTAPSAGALYPLETYIAVGAVVGLSAGLYRYEPRRHAIRVVVPNDLRRALAAAALGQECVENAPVVIGLAAVYERATEKYGERGRRYAHLEAGHAAQNVCLQATALGLGAVVVGAFDDDAVKRVMEMAAEEAPLCLLPVGRPAGGRDETP